VEASAEELFENAPCGYVATTPEGTLIRVNETFLRWTGYRREDLVGVKRFQDLLSVGGRIYHETHYAPLLQMQGSVREIAVEIVTAGGERLPVLVNSVLVRDESGAPRAIRTTVLDATERQVYERELLAARDREREARQRTERLQRITARLAAAPDARSIGAAAVEEVAAALEARAAGVALHDAATGELRPLAETGPRGSGGIVRTPLATAAGPLGVLWLEFDAARALEPRDRAFLDACAAQTAVGLERARLYEEASAVAHVLQRSLLAGAPPHDPRFEISTLYHPAVERLEVGGDWHDAFRLHGDRLGIVVGDVVGRGLRAASAMGQLRSAVRALAAAELEPAGVLRRLDTFVEQVAAARYATLAYAEVDPESGSVAVACAGHPPPITIDAGGAPRIFMEGRSPPLGVASRRVSRSQARFELTPGAGFLLYTDGLIERRTEPLDTGLERLLGAVRASPSPAPDTLVETLPGRLLEPGAAADDVCLLSFRRAA
jgi:PAS domain S-box-containing protein